MDAREFFHEVARRNYDEFCSSQTFKPLWNGSGITPLRPDGQVSVSAHLRSVFRTLSPCPMPCKIIQPFHIETISKIE